MKQVTLVAIVKDEEEDNTRIKLRKAVEDCKTERWALVVQEVPKGEC